MEAYRIRIIHASGHITVRDYAFSQTVALLIEAGTTDEQRTKFWARVDRPEDNHEPIVALNGDNIWLVKQV